MRLSLHILADWLKEYEPQCFIYRGERTIRNVRIFSDTLDFTPNNVYVSRTGFNSGNVICIHQNDYILLNTENEARVANQIMDAFDFYNDWSDRLNQELGELSLQDIVDRSAVILGYPLMVNDAAYYDLAHVISPEYAAKDPAMREMLETGLIGIDIILNVEKNPKIREPIRHCYQMHAEGFMYPTVVRNLFTGGNHWGWLISMCPDHTRGKMDIQDELGDILEQWMLQNHTQQKHWERSGVFLSLLEGDLEDKENIYYRLRLFGWPLQAAKWVYAITPGAKAIALTRKIEQLSHRVVALPYEDELLVFTYGTDAEREWFERELEPMLAQGECRCGVSPEFTDPFDLKKQVGLAKAATVHGKKDHIIRHFQDSVLSFGLSILTAEGGDWFAHPALAFLRDYDEKNHTDFYETLKVYLEQERSYAATSKALNLHRNTLLYRVERIGELTGLELDSPETRLHLRISFAMEDVAGKS